MPGCSCCRPPDRADVSCPLRKVTFRYATSDDCPRLPELNHQLIRDEGHRNPMTVQELEQRMRGWISGEYRAVIYEDSGEVVADALFSHPLLVALDELGLAEPHLPAHDIENVNSPAVVTVKDAARRLYELPIP